MKQHMKLGDTRSQTDVLVGVILAGGRSSRMGGGDKCLRELGGRTLLNHVADRVRPQVDTLSLNVNGRVERFEKADLPIAPDVLGEGFGPLAGILTGMEWARHHVPECDRVVTVPSDTPFLPADLVAGLLNAAGGRWGVACARSRGRLHPVIGLWPVGLADTLRQALTVEGLRAVGAWAERYLVGIADFDDENGIDPFFNVNRPGDLAMAEAMLRRT